MSITNYKKTGLFYGLSTAFPWSLWFIAASISHHFKNTIVASNLASIVAFLGLIAPVAVTFFIARKNKQLSHDLLNRFFNFKGIEPRFYLITGFVMLLSILLAQAVSLLFGYSPEQFHFAGHFSFTSGVFPAWFMLIIAPLLEELAWHSYGTDCLRSRFSLFNTSVIFALYWGIWHFPLSFIKDYYHSNLVEEGIIYSVNFLVSLFPFVIIMNWIYYKTNRNIIFPVIFHITAGFFNEIFATHPMSKVIQTGLLCIFSVYLLITNKEFFFKKAFQVDEENVQKKSKQKLVVNKSFLIALGFIFLSSTAQLSAQTLTQTIQGQVYDNLTNEPLPFASVAIINSNPLKGTVTDDNGKFTLENITIGRQTINVIMMGYETYELNELMVTSGQALNLTIGMTPANTSIEEAVVRVQKETALNSMITLSSRQFTVEETQRYAGGMDDPARLVSSFAGVATPSVSSNGISVRGNNPDGLLWRIDGVEVPTPNHFANLTIAGGGLLTALSNQMMANSDFYTGAFPAEYGNASSGVFDIKLKNGNPNERQYSFQAGVLGIGFSAEGPFSAKNDATYILNYRYSTMALAAPVLPDDTGILKYQDLAFKTNIPTKQLGIFSIWGIAALDGQEMDAADSTEWTSDFDRDESKTSLYMFTTAASHKISFNKVSFLNTTISISGSGLEHKEKRLDYNLVAQPQSKAANNSYQYTVQSQLTKRFGKSHNNKTGFRYSYLAYNIDVEQSLTEGESPTTIANQKGITSFFQAYTQSKFDIGSRLTINAGVNAQYFLLNRNRSIEPRLGIKYDINDKNSIALAYGLHSRLEQLPVYFVSNDGNMPNKNLKFMQSTHYVLSYSTKLSNNIRLCIEPYYQHLRNVPVSPNSYVSTLNNNNTVFYNEALVSEGNGHNIGIDVTLEKYLSKGFYYLLSGSLFDAKYTGIDGIERNTRFNRNYVCNAIMGKEWIVKKNNIFSANIRINMLGGTRIEPIDYETSLANKEIIYGETENNQAFSSQFKSQPIISFTLSYRKNKPTYSSLWSLQVLNASGTEEFSQDIFNLKEDKIETLFEGLMVPNVSYRIDF